MIELSRFVVLESAGFVTLPFVSMTSNAFDSTRRRVGDRVCTAARNVNVWNLTFLAPRSALARIPRLPLAWNVSGHREVDPRVASAGLGASFNRRFHYAILSAEDKNDGRRKKKSRGTFASGMIIVRWLVGSFTSHYLPFLRLAP